MKLHDTCSVQSLHGIPGLIAALLGAIFAACATFKEYKVDLYTIYPGRVPLANTTDFIEHQFDLKNAGIQAPGLGRTGLEQAGFQLIGLLITIGVALVTGAITGIILRLPVFEQLSEDVEMFDDEAQWVTPDDYALKLTFASSQTTQNNTEPVAVAVSPKKEDSKV